MHCSLRLVASCPSRLGGQEHLPGPIAAVASLPRPLTSFVGRQSECAEIARLLGISRLVTLLGAGGIGKTRLAIEVTRQVAGTYAGGARVVDLSSITDSRLVPQITAAALGVSEQQDRPLTETFVLCLESRRLLLVLDNCEHVLYDSAQLAHTLLQSTAEVTILATSRHRLRIPGETTWRVPPLAIPRRGTTNLDASSTQFGAVQLFVERAAAAEPGFRIDDRNPHDVERVCRELDGLPLPIELAAARVGAIGVDEIADRMSDRLGLLSGGSRVGPRRQRTMRETIDWSHDLLTDPERQLFERLAVFTSCFTLEAAEAVAVADDLDVPVINLLLELVDKSMVQVEPDADGTVRYRLLQTLQLYARERLQAPGEVERSAAHHARFFVHMVERGHALFHSRDARIWLNRLELEHDNLRAALAWSSVHDPQMGLRLCAALWWFWIERRHWREGLG
jgi:predicted ATPase